MTLLNSKGLKPFFGHGLKKHKSFFLIFSPFFMILLARTDLLCKITVILSLFSTFFIVEPSDYSSFLMEIIISLQDLGFIEKK
jgi:hypothetical protein